MPPWTPRTTPRAPLAAMASCCETWTTRARWPSTPKAPTVRRQDQVSRSVHGRPREKLRGTHEHREVVDDQQRDQDPGERQDGFPRTRGGCRRRARHEQRRHVQGVEERFLAI